MVKGFIFFRTGKIPFVIENYRMDLFTDDSLLEIFCKEYNFKENYILQGLRFDIGPHGRKATFLVENSMGSTCYLRCNGVQREHNKKLNNGLPILHKVPPKRDYGRYFCIMAEKGGTSHGGLTEKLSPFFHAKKQEVNAYGR